MLMKSRTGARAGGLAIIERDQPKICAQQQEKMIEALSKAIDSFPNTKLQ
jgi:hypothetical protein